jgi:hypothetical protein
MKGIIMADTIPHQDAVEGVIGQSIRAERVTQNANDELLYADRGTATIASPTAPSATYVQAEAASLKTAVDAIRVALIASGVTV